MRNSLMPALLRRLGLMRPAIACTIVFVSVSFALKATPTSAIVEWTASKDCGTGTVTHNVKVHDADLVDTVMVALQRQGTNANWVATDSTLAFLSGTNDLVAVTLYSATAGTYRLVVSAGDGSTLEVSGDQVIGDRPIIVGTRTYPSAGLCQHGRAAVAVSGGTPPIRIMWDGQTGTDSVDHLEPGYHTVIVEDDFGCRATQHFYVASTAPPLTAELLLIREVDGSLTLDAVAEGGTPSYAYSWEGSTSEERQLRGVAQGATYSVSVSDLNGCRTQVSIVADTLLSLPIRRSLRSIDLQVVSDSNCVRRVIVHGTSGDTSAYGCGGVGRLARVAWYRWDAPEVARDTLAVGDTLTVTGAAIIVAVVSDSSGHTGWSKVTLPDCESQDGSTVADLVVRDVWSEADPLYIEVVSPEAAPVRIVVLDSTSGIKFNHDFGVQHGLRKGYSFSASGLAEGVYSVQAYIGAALPITRNMRVR